jgi:signal transduction histidine kinase
MPNIKFTYLDKIIHEMNGQIHAISALSDIMLDDKIKLSESQNRENLEFINNAAAKLSKIASSLSSITALKSDKINIQPEEVDLIDLVKQETKWHQVRNKTNSDIKIDLTSKIPSCKAKVDGFWFKQMLANLIMNAINHCEKGLIEVHTNIIKKDGNDYFCLTVSDEGFGIPEDELETIFKPLERGSHSLEKNIPGSGIGLAIVKEVIEAHDGSILAKNGLKVGAVFEVLIPLNDLS